ncbi:MAG: hypothetical protein H8D45_05935 [Bacteroidetes bacterium]|nr:hypothetical protein [Bacteroidota bacterium]
MFLINLNIRNYNKSFSSFINLFKSSINYTLPLLLAITLYYNFSYLLESDNYRILDAESDNYRIFEATYVFEEYIRPNLLLGGGLGSQFFTPKGEIETDVHLGLFTVMLKFGLIGICLLFFLLINFYLKYFIYSRSRKRLFKESVLLLVPSLTIWSIYIVVAKGLFPESLFGIGLSIGLYLKNKALIKSALYLPMQKAAPPVGLGTPYSVFTS